MKKAWVVFALIVSSINAFAEPLELNYTEKESYKSYVLTALLGQQIASPCLSGTFGGFYLETLVKYSGRAILKDSARPNQVTFELYMPSKYIEHGYPQGSYIVESTFNISEGSKIVTPVKLEMLSWAGIRGTESGPQNVWESSVVKNCN